MIPTGCLADDDLTLFLGGQLSSEERHEFELHLSPCRRCRKRLVNMYELSKTESAAVRAPRILKARALHIPERRRVIIPSLLLGLRRQRVAVLAVVLAVAAGVTGLLLLNTSRGARRFPPTDVLRQEPQTTPAPQLLAPAAGETIASDQIEFRWSKVPGAGRYTLTLLDQKGDILVQTSTTEERFALSAASSVRLERNETYFWYVRARMPDGTAVDSSMRKLITADEHR